MKPSAKSTKHSKKKKYYNIEQSLQVGVWMAWLSKFFGSKDNSKLKNIMGFIVNNDGTVTDPELRVLWQMDDDGIQRTYPEASNYCRTLQLGGYGDWRLPRKDELMRLGKIKYNNLQQIFPNIQKERYWALTIPNEVNWAGDASDKIVYTVAFDPSVSDYGQDVTYFKTNDYCVKAVRKY